MINNQPISKTRLYLLCLFIVLTIQTSFGQKEMLKSGPMLGPVTLRTAKIWLQTTESVPVYIQYKEKSSSSEKRTSDIFMTDSYAHTLTIDLNGLKTGTTYEYELFINNIPVLFDYPLQFTTQTHWAFRTEPPAFRFALGSCFYINDPDYDRPGVPYGGEYGIIKQMMHQKPDFMIWAGDNIYLREGDYDSRHGIFNRQAHTRSLPELQPYLASQPHYATWDDHDYGPNDSDWTYPLKRHSLEAFREFWPSDAYGAGSTEGVTSGFVWNDCQFFLLDNRWYRTVERERGSILGETQLSWLLESLRGSKAFYKFVVVGGQFLSDVASFENHANYAKERQMIIDYIDKHKINGVIFLTGDRHHSEVTRLKTNDGVVIYDITSSALTSKTTDHSEEKNSFRIPGSMIGQRNFAIVEVNGKRKERNAHVTFFNSQGEQIFNHILNFE